MATLPRTFVTGKGNDTEKAIKRYRDRGKLVAAKKVDLDRHLLGLDAYDDIRPLDPDVRQKDAYGYNDPTTVTPE
jgi:Mg/Co/Ni transporter MgtE